MKNPNQNHSIEEIYSIAKNLIDDLLSNKDIHSQYLINYIRKSYPNDILDKYCVVGKLHTYQQIILKSETEKIKLSVDSITKNILVHPDIKLHDYQNINHILNNADDIIPGTKNHIRCFKTIDGKLYEIIIKTTKNKKENYLLSLHRCDYSRLKNLKR